MSDRRNRRGSEPWGPDIAGVLVCLVIAGMLGLSAAGFLVLVCVAGGVIGYRQGRAERRAGRRREAADLPRRQGVSRPRDLPMPRPASPALRRSGPGRRYEPDVPDDLDGWDHGDDWDLDDDWDFDDDSYRRPRRGRHRHGESWEIDDADYI